MSFCLLVLICMHAPWALVNLKIIPSVFAHKAHSDYDKKAHKSLNDNAYLYSVFLVLSLVSMISSPFFIQKLSRWLLWEAVRLHWRVIELLEPMVRIICSDESMDGSENTDAIVKYYITLIEVNMESFFPYVFLGTCV